MAAASQPFAIRFLLFLLLSSQVGRAFAFFCVLGIRRILPKCGQQISRAGDFVFVRNPDAPAVIVVLFELVFDALHVKIIGKSARRIFISQMADETHLGKMLANRGKPRSFKRIRNSASYDAQRPPSYSKLLFLLSIRKESHRRGLLLPANYPYTLH